MALKPGDKSPYDICFTDNRSKQEWYIKLDGGGSGVERSALSDDSNALYFRSTAKRVGDFDEQRSWKGGRGREYFNDDPTGYFDGRGIWSLADGHLINALQWHWATGYRTVDMDWPGSVSWKALIPGSSPNYRYLSRSFQAGATYDMDKCWLLIRRVGNPGTLTLELCSDNSGDPGTVQKSATVDTTSITDTLSEFWVFDWSTVFSATSGVTYHLKVYGAAGDNADNHWEVAVRTDTSNSKTSPDNTTWTAASFSLYFRITDADTDRRWFIYGNENGMYAVDKKASGNSQHYTISAGVLTENATTGLGTVVSKPVISSGFHFFPQGESVAPRRWNGTQWRSEGSNRASFMSAGYVSADGPVVWCARTSVGSSGKSQVQRAQTVKNDGTPIAWAADGANMLSLGSVVRVGDTATLINNIYWWGGGGLYIFKTAELWVVQTDKPVMMDYGLRSTPSADNGIAAIGNNQFLYFNWLFSVERLYGSTLDDIGQGWRGPALPNKREGIISAFCSYVAWMFAAVDAGPNGTSSVMCWDGLAWHEVFRAPAVGMRIRDVAIQSTSGAAANLWIDCGGDLIYITLPFNKANPLYDPTVQYMHEGAVVSSTIDMGAASKLPKFIRDLTATVAKLDGTNIKVDVEYQYDDDIGTDNWIPAVSMLSSPESTSRINLGNITQFRYRLRLQTNDVLVTPDIRGVVPSGYARSPFRWLWNLRARAGETVTTGGKKVTRNDLDAWITEAAKVPGRVIMTSKYEILHNYSIIVGTPTTRPISAPARSKQEKDIYTITVIEA